MMTASFPGDAEIAECLHSCPTGELCEAAHEVTLRCAHKKFDMCSIINAKSGRCGENCKWCAQSAHFHTNAENYPLLPYSTVKEHALYNERKGVGRFSLVTSGKRPSESEVGQICGYIEKLSECSGINICLSLGLADENQLAMLKRAGAARYHCNLESAPSFFGKLCTTHTQEEKIETLKAARKAGLEICSGGIIGMGEGERERIELALTLRKLEVESIPINILHPVPGTPLENMEPIPDEQIVRTVAIFRLINPFAYLRLAGGRTRLGKETLAKLLHAGINAAIVGDLLTTLGSDMESDKKCFREAGYEL